MHRVPDGRLIPIADAEQFGIDLGDSIRGIGFNTQHPHANSSALNLGDRRADRVVKCWGSAIKLHKGNVVAHVKFDIAARGREERIGQFGRNLCDSGKNECELIGAHRMSVNNSNADNRRRIVVLRWRDSVDYVGLTKLTFGSRLGRAGSATLPNNDRDVTRQSPNRGFRRIAVLPQFPYWRACLAPQRSPFFTTSQLISIRPL
jgi:hypothetical protein